MGCRWGNLVHNVGGASFSMEKMHHMVMKIRKQKNGITLGMGALTSQTVLKLDVLIQRKERGMSLIWKQDCRGTSTEHCFCPWPPKSFPLATKSIGRGITTWYKGRYRFDGPPVRLHYKTFGVNTFPCLQTGLISNKLSRSCYLD